MTEALPQLRRTPLRRALDDDVAMPPDAIATMGVFMADLSALPRLGFKGRGTIAAMKTRSVTVEAETNKAFVQPDGGLCLVLAPGEVILLGNPLAGAADSPDAAAFDGMLTSWKLEDEERTYPLLRRDSHAWFVLGGKHAGDMLAKICGVDLRPHKFANHSIAQTSVAKMSAIVTRADFGTTLTFHLLADSAAALYFWTSLMDAAHEFGGRRVGLTALAELKP